MLLKPLICDPSRLACVLDKLEDCFVWLDSSDFCAARNCDQKDHGFSLMAFDPAEEVMINSYEDRGLFFSFFNSFVLSQSKAETGLCYSWLENAWLGFLSYEAYGLNPLIPHKPSQKKQYPLVLFRKFRSFVLFDHQTNKTFFVGFSTGAEKRYKSLVRLLETQIKNCGAVSLSELCCETNYGRYQNDFFEIRRALLAGDYFELNYTMEYNGKFYGAPLFLFLQLRRLMKAPMMAYIKSPEITVLSASPERFFKVNQNKISAFPIKGTIARGNNYEEDEKNKQNLLSSQKDQAELLMVTDMLRNDLGRFCKPGTVVVEKLFEAQTFSHYHHLVSKISGLIDEKVSLFDVFCALFPCGSITGAPKIKVIEHTDKLEKRARGIYTGAVGIITDSGFVDFNIPIRTITLQNNNICFATGGGVVADSDCQAEYNECLLKISGLVEVFQNGNTLVCE